MTYRENEVSDSNFLALPSVKEEAIESLKEGIGSNV
jgi:hypothetical protein